MIVNFAECWDLNVGFNFKFTAMRRFLVAKTKQTPRPWRIKVIKRWSQRRSGKMITTTWVPVLTPKVRNMFKKVHKSLTNKIHIRKRRQEDFLKNANLLSKCVRSLLSSRSFSSCVESVMCMWKSLWVFFVLDAWHSWGYFVNHVMIKFADMHVVIAHQFLIGKF